MSRFRFLLLSIIVLSGAFGLRCAVAYWWQQRLAGEGQRFSMGDSESYWFLARQLATGQPYFYNTPDASVFRTPGYPWLLSFVVDPQDMDRHVLSARVLGCVMGTMAIAICMLLAAVLYGRTPALVCGVLGAIYPGAITTSVLVLSEAPFMPLMMLVLLALSFAQRQPERVVWWTIVAGIASGLAILVRPSWLLFMPFFYGYRFCFARERTREFMLALLAGVAIAAVMTPWWIRNYQVTGHFVLTTLQTGPTLYDGFHPAATGGSDSGMTFTGEFAAELRQEDETRDKPLGNFEFRLNQRLASAAKDWVIANPGQAILLGAKKFYRTWWPLPSVSEIPGGLLTRLIFAIGMLGILVPGVTWGFRALFHLNNPALPIMLTLVYFALLHTVFVGSIRYRQPAIFALTVLAAPQLLEWAQRLSARLKRQPKNVESVARL